jgi:predicted metal-dependent enzyme (double-stranded beta helix superfamily)
MSHDAESSPLAERTRHAPRAFHADAGALAAPLARGAQRARNDNRENGLEIAPAGARTLNAGGPLARLCGALDAAFHEAAHAGAAEPSHRAEFARRVRAALAAAADATGNAALLTPAQREGSPDGYRRHLLAADRLGRYTLVALVWQPGQASPVHAHHTWCGYAVLDGTLTETVYDWNDAAGCATEARTHARAAGAVSYARAGTTGIHRLANASGASAVSLHLYGVAGPQVATHVNDLVRVERSALR